MARRALRLQPTFARRRASDSVRVSQLRELALVEKWAKNDKVVLNKSLRNRLDLLNAIVAHTRYTFGVRDSGRMRT